MKYTTTNEEYNNRMTEADYVEELLTSREGCRALTLLMLGMAIVALLIFAYIKIR